MSEASKLEAECRRMADVVEGMARKKSTGDDRDSLCKLERRTRRVAKMLRQVLTRLDVYLWYRWWKAARLERSRLEELRLDARKALCDWAEWRARDNPA